MLFRTLLFLIACGTYQIGFGSGGPNNPQKYECVGTTTALIQLRLEEAYSSELRGHATAFDDKNRLGFPKTAAESCREVKAIAATGQTGTDVANLVCGNEKSEGQTAIRIEPNNAGFRFLVWLDENQHATKARLEKKEGEAFQNVFGDMPCRIKGS
jgi:hypothetical protein